jgi:uncharacterized phage protein (TIGR01671 family)
MKNREIKFRAFHKHLNEMLTPNQWHNYGAKIVGGVLESEDCILMQFTGLTDKHGKEIYEGDIIHSDQWQPSTYQICYDRGAFYIAGADKHEVADIKYAEGFKVIGNIHENPELLTP